MSQDTANGQNGGVNIGGSVGSVGGDIVGRDKIVYASPAAIDDALRPLTQAIDAAPVEARIEAEAKLMALKDEAAKGANATDSLVAKLVEGLVTLVPGVASAVIGAFTTPALGSIAGPITGFVLDKLRGG